MVEEIGAATVPQKGRLLREVGATLADVFGADNVLSGLRDDCLRRDVDGVMCGPGLWTKWKGWILATGDEGLSTLEGKYDGYTVYDRDGDKIG